MKYRQLCILSLILLVLTLALTGCSVADEDLSGDSQATSISEETEESSVETDEMGATETRIETEYFVLIANEGNPTYLDDVLEVLENKREIITSDLNLEEAKKVTFMFYPTLEKYHAVIGKPDAPDWVVGSAASPTAVKMISLDCENSTHDYDELLEVAVHELTHCYAMQINPRIWKQRWLSEGIALYEAGQMIKGEIPQGSIDKINSEGVPTLRDINRTDEEHISLVYMFGYDLIEFVINTWGADKLPDLIETTGDIEEVLGVTEEEFDEMFNEYFKSKYSIEG